MKKRVMTLLLAAVMLLSVLSACGASGSSNASESQAVSGTDSVPEVSETAPAAPEQTAEPAGSEMEAEGSKIEVTEPEEAFTVEYPLCEEGEVTLSVFMPMAGFIPLVIPNVAYDGFDKCRGIMELERATGVDLEWTLIDQDSYAEQFSIMLATGDYPDYLGAADSQVTGGIDALVDQEICIDLAPMLDEFMPDFKNGFFAENEEYRKYITSDSGHITTIDNYEMQSSSGSYIRKDWLDQLGMEIPETYDELHEVLKGFATIEGCKYPMLMTSGWSYWNNMFVGGYETSSHVNGSDLAYFVQDGQVNAGVMSEGFKDYIQMVHDWYDEGIIGEASLNIANIQQINEYLLSNQCGFGVGQSDTLSTGSIETAGGTYDMRAIHEIVRNKGDTFKLFANKGTPGTAGWAISTRCAYPEIAAEVINWMYTEEGYNAMNYGIEGETYNVVDGKIVFTDLIVNNPNGFPAMFNTCSEIAFFDLPFVNSTERKAATLSNEAEVEAQTIWRTNTSDEMRYFGSLTVEESDIYSGLIGDIATATSENVSKFVLGARPMDEWDSFLDDLRSMGVDECIALKQQAYDRYMAR